MAQSETPSNTQIGSALRDAYRKTELQRSASMQYPSNEPYYAQRDDELLDYLESQCVEEEIVRSPDGSIYRRIKNVRYPHIRDLVRFPTSHLVGNSFLNDQQASVQLSLWRRDWWKAVVRHRADHDARALSLLTTLDGLMFNTINGRAHQGTQQKFVATIAGAYREITVGDGGRTGGIIRRLVSK